MMDPAAWGGEGSGLASGGDLQAAKQLLRPCLSAPATPPVSKRWLHIAGLSTGHRRLGRDAQSAACPTGVLAIC